MAILAASVVLTKHGPRGDVAALSAARRRCGAADERLDPSVPHRDVQHDDAAGGRPRSTRSAQLFGRVALSSQDLRLLGSADYGVQ